MHDAVHAALHANRRVNDGVGFRLCSASLRQYRPYHQQHHRFAQQAEDPDLVLSAPFPITRESFVRKMIRDLTRQTFVKRRFGHIAHRIRARAATAKMRVRQHSIAQRDDTKAGSKRSLPVRQRQEVQALLWQARGAGHAFG